MLNIVIPMAGAGSRFRQQGFKEPKPLIPIDGIPMIRVVINNLRPKRAHKFVFVCQQSHIAEYSLKDKLQQWAPGSDIVAVDGLTEGAACTVLAAERIIDSEQPLMIANSDQFIDTNIDSYLAELEERHLDGLIMTMTASDPKWSFVAHDAHALGIEVAEKRVISSQATVGIYNFARGDAFVASAKKMIRRNLRVNNEFYVAPVYNQLIEAGSRVGTFNIGREGDGMYGLGTPSDLMLFNSLEIHKQATALGD
jgi:dTDP-glucose pyrophosphorylase